MSADTMDLLREFGAFEDAAAPEQSEDCLDKIETFVRTCLGHVEEVEALKEKFAKDGPKMIFGQSCSPYAMRSELWSSACDRVARDYVKPFGVEVGDIPVHIAQALGWTIPQKPSWVSCSRNDRPATPPGESLLGDWSAVLIRQHFATVIGDPREKRIAQLREVVMEASRYDRPEKKWAWGSGSHHQARCGGNGRMVLTYSTRTIETIKSVMKYVIHLTTGEDPSLIVLPPIFGLSDGLDEWSPTDLYRRMKAPFPGAIWMRFTAGNSIEFGLEPQVLARLQTQWDLAQAKREALAGRR